MEEKKISGGVYRVNEEKVEKYVLASEEEVLEKLLEVSSHEVMDFGDFGDVKRMYVSYGRLLEMIDDGYNIIRLLNPDDVRDTKIYIECQEYIGKKEMFRK